MRLKTHLAVRGTCGNRTHVDQVHVKQLNDYTEQVPSSAKYAMLTKVIAEISLLQGLVFIPLHEQNSVIACCMVRLEVVCSKGPAGLAVQVQWVEATITTCKPRGCKTSQAITKFSTFVS